MNPSMRPGRPMRWREVLPAFAIVFLLALVLVSGARASESRWVASWAAAPQDFQQMQLIAAQPEPVQSLGPQTLRLRVQPTLGGHRIRVRFSNVFGKVPLHIQSASVATSTGDDAVSPASLKRLQFKGRAELTLAPGAEAWSDAATFELDPGQPIAISLFADRPTPIATVHRLPHEPTFMLPGDAVMQARWQGAQPSAWNHVVTGLDVARAEPVRVVVAFGDSITAGVGVKEGPGLPSRYPDRLAARLRDLPGSDGRLGVINAGISGNRLLADQIGPKAIGRFDRDALGQSGVTAVVILIGINDIGFTMPGMSSPVPSLTRGLQSLVDRARARGVKVMLGTLPPFKGAAYWSEEKEGYRLALNRWIRGRLDVDAVVDFDAVMRDANDPSMLNPLYDSGDHLHPGNAGYAAMADAIDAETLRE